MNPNIEVEEKETDYDPFASFRPTNTIDINTQEIEQNDNDPFASLRPKVNENEFDYNDYKSTSEFTQEEERNDYLKQLVKESLIGFGGTYGDLIELAGIRQENVGQNERSTAEHDVLTRMKEPGYKPSFYDLEALSDQGEGIGASGLPSSNSLRELNELSGGPGEPKTPGGKYGARQGKLYGSGAAFGQFNPIPSLAAGAAGQVLEESGADPLIQAAGEIATLLLTGSKGTGKGVQSNKKEVAEKINKLRSLGYTEEDITLAINSASKGKKFGVKATKGTSTEQAFENFAEHSDELVEDILSKQIPGSEKGIQKIHELASDAYGEVVKQGSQLVIKDSTPFIKSATDVVREVRKTLGKNPEAEAFIKRLAEAVKASTKNPTADNFINFYKELNSLGKWMNRSQKDHLITKVKEGIKDTFKSEGPAGQKLAANFDNVNKGVQKAYQAQELLEIIDKTKTAQGFDYKKLNKTFDKAENVKLFQTVLGKKQADNLKFIAKSGSEIKDFDKAWKAVNLLEVSPTSVLGSIGYLIYSGNWAAIGAVKGLQVTSKILAEKALTDPKFQSLLIRGIHAIKNEAPRAFKTASDALQEYLDEENIKY